jgi:hypothetical protein
MNSLSPVNPISTFSVCIGFSALLMTACLVMDSGRFHLSKHITYRTIWKPMLPTDPTTQQKFMHNVLYMLEELVAPHFS